MPFFKKEKNDGKINEIIHKLDELNMVMNDVQERVDMIEDVLAKRLPPDILTERKFVEEVETGDEIVEKLLSDIQGMVKKNSVRSLIEDRIDDRFDAKPTRVETKRIEKITRVLQNHDRLSSNDLSDLIGLSRTRCNEYFKQMQELGIVEPVREGRKKFYRLS